MADWQSLDPEAAREAEKYDNPIPSRELILQRLADRGEPAAREELAKEFGLYEEDQIEALRRRLRAMERDGQLIYTRRGTYAPVDKLDLICGPKQFDEFIMPWFRKFTNQAHEHGYQVVLHSCGAIHRVINSLIDSKVDCLHPLQAKASQMDAETLSKDFKGKITFMGGIDTQELLVKATPEEVKEEVARIKKLLGPNLIISPSHEALLPDVPPENVKAMAEAATC